MTCEGLVHDRFAFPDYILSLIYGFVFDLSHDPPLELFLQGIMAVDAMLIIL